jgi:Fe-S cluster assembly iron-binding protein IscA
MDFKKYLTENKLKNTGIQLSIEAGGAAHASPTYTVKFKTDKTSFGFEFFNEDDAKKFMKSMISISNKMSFAGIVK